MRRALALVAGVALLGSACAPRPHRPPAAAGRRATITARLVAGNLNFPAAFAFAPTGRIFYGEKTTGRIQVLDPKTGRHHGFFHVSNVSGSGEQGLLGIAVPRGFPRRTPFLYAYATRQVGGALRNQILRIKASNGKGTAASVIFTSSTPPASNHNGGHIAFGPDGMLYAVVGEAGNPANAQDLSVTGGKILRMTPSGQPAPGNHFGTRVDVFGVRNSFGFAFDPRTGRLWETENGPECNDELNRIVAGRNYGWGPHETCSGRAPRNTNQDGSSPMLPFRWFTPPIAPTGIAFCRRCGLGESSNGTFFFGAYNTGDIRRVRLTRDRLGIRAQTVVYHHGSGILSIQAAPNGHLFFSDGSGIYRLVFG